MSKAIPGKRDPINLFLTMQTSDSTCLLLLLILPHLFTLIKRVDAFDSFLFPENG